MPKAVLFRTSIAGYHKKDVNDYIAATAKETRSLLAEKDEAIAELKESLNVAEENCRSRLQEQKSQTQQEAQALSGKLSSLETKLNQLLASFDACQEEAGKSQLYAAKAKKYDALAGTLGELLQVEIREEAAQQQQCSGRGEWEASLKSDLEALASGLSRLLEQDKAE